MNSAANRMDANLTSMWVSFFTTAGIPSDVAATYALTFTENRIQNDMLLDLNKEYLRDMGISRMGDVIAILRHAKQVHESTARDRVLSTTVISNKVPVAAVTGRATVAQPSSPASRILEHYTRNVASKESSPVQAQKRKSNEMQSHTVDLNIKKARLIRFGTPPKATVKEAAVSKQTVFARLGNSEPVAAIATVKTTTIKTDAKPIFARLGSKTDDPVPVQKDALKYEGILKSTPSFKTVTVTTTKNNVRKIACTMRADEAPLSAKEKLAVPKATSKSVKFSNTVQYKEIEAVKKAATVKPKLTPVFNKPERRLSMPEGSVKARLGMKANTNNLTITKNVFNRLGV
ncbi:uncharacterized protein C19orf47-like [Pectinophora gossypiella]|uniref:uncharacterized protein C19orf47-like n=1 Tax=Pectinophora gossypiella TaxID=13191 RepID=UPI00214E31D6|nr:uncharacterized protein C19orf47-like [Pectinophora gossypiella]